MKRLYLFDENMSKWCGPILEYLFKDQEFRSIGRAGFNSVKDTDWIAQVADWNPKPVIVSLDRKMVRNRVEREALKQAGISGIFIKPNWMDWKAYEQAWRLIRMWPRIHERINEVPDPILLEVDLRFLNGIVKIEL